jgi:hypothetical protein
MAGWRSGEEIMPNGKRGDHPLTDILHWKILRFSEKADGLIAEIVQLGGTAELEKRFNLFVPPPIPEFEKILQEIRDRLYREAKERGWEV